MKIETELDVVSFARNSKGLSDAKVIKVLNTVLKALVSAIPKDRELLAERLERFYKEFPNEKPLFIDFNKPTQLGNLKG